MGCPDGGGWHRVDIQGQHIECKDGGRREAGVQTRILLLVSRLVFVSN